MFKKFLFTSLLAAFTCQGAVAGILPKDSAEQYEITFWNSIKDSTHPEDYEHYLQAYPKGRFATLAEGRIKRLRLAAARAEPLPPAPPSAAILPAATPPAAPAAKPARKKPRPTPVPARMLPPPMPVPELPPVAVHQPRSAPAPQPATKEWKDCPDCPTLVELPKGLLTMGSNSGEATARPSHSVALNGVFAIGKQEVTVEQWDACVEAGACAPVPEDATTFDTDPVRLVNWEDAQRYVQWLRSLTGKPYRLPTEAEWEYAARGGSAEPAPAAAYRYGIEGMDGGVWEWVSDCWHDSYKGAPPDGSAWDEPDCQMRVIRGGPWRKGLTRLDATSRWRDFASVRDPQNGFRVARDGE